MIVFCFFCTSLDPLLPAIFFSSCKTNTCIFLKQHLSSSKQHVTAADSLLSTTFEFDSSKNKPSWQFGHDSQDDGDHLSENQL